MRLRGARAAGGEIEPREGDVQVSLERRRHRVERVESGQRLLEGGTAGGAIGDREEHGAFTLDLRHQTCGRRRRAGRCFRRGEVPVGVLPAAAQRLETSGADVYRRQHQLGRPHVGEHGGHLVRRDVDAAGVAVSQRHQRPVAEHLRMAGAEEPDVRGLHLFDGGHRVVATPHGDHDQGPEVAAVDVVGAGVIEARTENRVGPVAETLGLGETSEPIEVAGEVVRAVPDAEGIGAEDVDLQRQRAFEFGHRRHEVAGVAERFGPLFAGPQDPRMARLRLVRRQRTLEGQVRHRQGFVVPRRGQRLCQGPQRRGGLGVRGTEYALALCHRTTGGGHGVGLASLADGGVGTEAIGADETRRHQLGAPIEQRGQRRQRRRRLGAAATLHQRLGLQQLRLQGFGVSGGQRRRRRHGQAGHGSELRGVAVAGQRVAQQVQQPDAHVRGGLERRDLPMRPFQEVDHAEIRGALRRVEIGVAQHRREERGDAVGLPLRGAGLARLPGGDAGAGDDGGEHGGGGRGRDAMAPDELPRAIQRAIGLGLHRLAVEPAPQVVGERRDAVVAAGGLLAQGLEQDRVEIAGQRAPPRGRRGHAARQRRRVAEDRFLECAGGVTGRHGGAAAGEQLVGEDGQRVDVGGDAERTPLHLFRRRVGESECPAAVCGESVALGALRVDQRGDAEVEQPDAALDVDQHVRRLEVAMDDEGAVGVGDRAGDLQHEPDDGACVESLRRDPRVDRLPVHEFHRQERLARRRHAGVVQPGDVRVLEPRQDVALARQPFGQPRPVRHTDWQLEGDGAIEDAIRTLGHPHDGLAPTGQQPYQPVGADDHARLERLCRCADLVGVDLEGGERVEEGLERGRVELVQHHLQTRLEGVVIGREPVEPRRAFGRRHGQGFVDESVQRAQPVEVESIAHRSISASISRARSQSRRTVRSVTPSAAAASLSVMPAKKRISTTWAARASTSANASRASCTRSTSCSPWRVSGSGRSVCSVTSSTSPPRRAAWRRRTRSTITERMTFEAQRRKCTSSSRRRSPAFTNRR